MTDPILTVPPALAPFVKAILACPDLQSRLGRHGSSDAFVSEAMTVAAESGMTVDEAELREAIAPDPLGLARFGAAQISMSDWPKGDWLPTSSIHGTSPPHFDWAWFGDRRLRESFFQDSSRQASNLPLNLLCRTRTDLAAVIEGAPNGDIAPLSGLIFHMSRCGSTLVAQMLGASPDHIVVSEPEPLDAVLLWVLREKIPEAEAVAALRAIVAALGRRRGTSAQRLFVKLDAWHALCLPLFRTAFPDVPWTYLFRDPLGVLVSHQFQAGGQAIGGVLPVEASGLLRGNSTTPQEETARALDVIGRSILDHWHLGGGMVLEYSAIVDRGAAAIVRHFEIPENEAVTAAMQAATARDSKAADRPFSGVADIDCATTASHNAAMLLQETHGHLTALSDR